MQKKAIIYCFADSHIYPGDQREFLDVCFFRLLAYAYAHGMQVEAYYEDTQEGIGDDIRLGLVQMQQDFVRNSCDAILVIDLNQLPENFVFKYSKEVISIKITERTQLMED